VFSLRRAHWPGRRCAPIFSTSNAQAFVAGEQKLATMPLSVWAAFPNAGRIAGTGGAADFVHQRGTVAAEHLHGLAQKIPVVSMAVEKLFFIKHC